MKKENGSFSPIKKIFYINNLALNDVDEVAKYQSQMVNKIAHKFKELDKRNKGALGSFERKMFGGGPNELVTKKMRYEEKNIAENEEKKKKITLVLKKQSSSKPIVIEENYVNGWEAEDDLEQNYTWI